MIESRELRMEGNVLWVIRRYTHVPSFKMPVHRVFRGRRLLQGQCSCCCCIQTDSIVSNDPLCQSLKTASGFFEQLVWVGRVSSKDRSAAVQPP